MTKKELVGFIDHTLLKPGATKKDIEKLCSVAKRYKFASVCINSFYVKLASKFLKNSGVKVCTVIGFPLGATTTNCKAYQTDLAVKEGADEVDMVINIGALRSKDYTLVEKDVANVVKSAKKKNAIVKVILETGLLNKNEIIKACKICEKAKADFVKTSTGFGPRGATIDDVKLMRKSCHLKVKAAGGVRTLNQALAMIEAGANRIGCSAGKSIVDELKK